MVQLRPIKSSSATHIGYDLATRTLAVTFKNGHTYHYTDVPAELARQAEEAPSIGRYLHDHIVGKYVAAKQEPHP